MKKIYIILIGLIFNLPLQAQDLSQLIEKVSPAIFKITTYDANSNELAVGTGFFINSSGTALTNYHVVQGATKAKIKTSDNKIYLIDNILSWSKESDLVKFTVRNELSEVFTFLKLSSATPKAGEHIFIIGNPLGLDKTVSDGIVSSVRQDDNYGETIQITAPISQGNSGSPLMNLQGEALGIVTYYLQDGQNLNFAVSVKNLNILEPVNALTFPADDNITITNNTSSSLSTDDYSNPTSILYYTNSSVKFCTELNDNQQPQNPGDLFYINKEGSWVYVFVKNDKALSTDELIMDVYRKKGKEYDEFVETKRYTVDPTWYDTHFKYSFYEAGDYKLSVYSSNESWINTGYVSIKVTK